MSQRRATTQVANSILRKLVKSSDLQHAENTKRLIEMSALMQAHIEADARAFEATNKEILEINKDVKTLLASRSFLRGAWFAVVIAATFLATVIGIAITWWK